MRFGVKILALLFLLTSPPLASGGEVLFSEYWSRPFKIHDGSQGALELYPPYPEDCSKCHEDQYRDWSGSLHSKSVGPGLVSQFNPETNPSFAISCYFCHAPAVEQTEVIGSGSGYKKNPSFDSRLKRTGVSCTVCHQRSSTIHGPEPSAQKVRKEDPGHDFVESKLFGKAEFCKACHQLDQGFKLNGKVLTNTYREWKESFYGKNNIPCQSCHMPGRRHLFRGIHDPEMVRSGVKIEAQKETIEGGERLRLKLTNAGVGHYFPTYVTPQVVVRGFLVDSKGSVLEHTLKEAFIGRKVPLGLSEELFDTRVPPLGTFDFTYDVRDPEGAEKVVLEVWVYPDEFYNRFFASALKNSYNYVSRSEAERAWEATESSPYLLFKKDFAVKSR